MKTPKIDKEPGDADELIARMSGTPDILIVDDVHANIFLLENLLSDMYKVESVTSAEAMWKFLKRVRPGLILLDLMMPFENGYDILEKITVDEKLKSIPIIVVTAKDRKEDVVKCLRYGVRDYIVKPIDEITLLRKVGKVIGPGRAGIVV